ncbi:hypothetical protein PMM47T1_18130 [Pseudomonas sp. M47T1]|uniref:hypothetical protein n=1 Tax=unclassified Pseudomonas TaxID=196821 RepID=UPI000260681B|nr:hypothetical protein [Pseudomonas sp. M47T1]EIK95151.1 hypothetical protein PMM47T1_18130 [Pseudomonas sp. M47T1]
MQDTLIAKARQSVIDVHVLIQQVLGKDGVAIPELMSRFAPEFTMVTPKGMELTRPQTEVFFNANIGARAGLDIVLEDFRTVAVDGQTVTLRYTEIQHLNGQRGARLSVAVLRVTEAATLWLYLQETALP